MASQPHQQPDRQQSNANDTAQSEKQAAVTPSGPRGDNPATAGPGTPENNLGHLNPSAPEDANTTPGSTGKK